MHALLAIALLVAAVSGAEIDRARRAARNWQDTAFVKRGTADITAKIGRDRFKCFSQGSTYELVAQTYCVTYLQTTASGEPVLHSCSNGNAFDLDACACNRAEYFDCPDGNLPRTAAPTSAFPTTTLQVHTEPPVRIGNVCIGDTKIFGLVPNTGCARFTQQTQGGRQFEMACPEGLKFDLNICVCRFAWDFACPDKTPSVAFPTRPLPTSSPESNIAPVRIGGECHFGRSIYRVAPQSGCSKFTQQGEDGGIFVHDCPAGLKFSLDACVCTYAGEVQCLDETIVTARPPVQAPTAAVITKDKPVRKGDSCLSNGNVYTILAAGGCRRFGQQIADGTMKVQNCPAGLRFDLNSCVCNYDYLVECADNGFIRPELTTVATTISAKTNLHPVRVGDACVVNGYTFRLLAYCGCSRYTQKLDNGDITLRECSAGLLFDLNTCTCRPAGSFLCDDPSPPKNIPMSTQPAPPKFISTASVPVMASEVLNLGRRTCIAAGNVFRIVRNSACQRFTQEAPGDRIFENSCLGGSRFDMNLCVCRFPQDVQCIEE